MSPWGPKHFIFNHRFAQHLMLFSYRMYFYILTLFQIFYHQWTLSLSNINHLISRWWSWSFIFCWVPANPFSEIIIKKANKLKLKSFEKFWNITDWNHDTLLWLTVKYVPKFVICYFSKRKMTNVGTFFTINNNFASILIITLFCSRDFIYSMSGPQGPTYALT